MIPEEEKQIVRRFMNGMTCPKEFSCLSSGPEGLCRARDIGSDIYVECLEPLIPGCSFSVPSGATNFCKCPIRIYLTRQPSRSATKHRTLDGVAEIEHLN